MLRRDRATESTVSFGSCLALTQVQRPHLLNSWCYPCLTTMSQLGSLITCRCSQDNFYLQDTAGWSVMSLYVYAFHSSKNISLQRLEIWFIQQLICHFWQSSINYIFATRVQKNSKSWLTHSFNILLLIKWLWVMHLKQTWSNIIPFWCCFWLPDKCSFFF